MLKLEYYGEGSPVLLLCGGVVLTDTVAPIRDHLATHYQVIVPDFAGIGVSLDASVDMLVRALAEAGIEEAACIGHSSGFHRALILADSGAIRVTGIVGLGSIAYSTPEVLTTYAGLADGIDAGAINPPDVALNMWYTPSYLEANPDAEPRLRGWFDRLGNALVSQALREEFVGPDLHPRLEHIDVPVYMRVGELDGATPPAMTIAIAEGLPNATYDVVPGAGHFLQDEDRAETLAAIDRFLAQLEYGSART
jgi:3-oxoadipate enol-lactonase